MTAYLGFFSIRATSPSEVRIGQGDLYPPSMPGEVDLCPLDFSPHLLETESLERKLEPVGVGDFGATPYGSGLVLHDGQWESPKRTWLAKSSPTEGHPIRWSFFVFRRRLDLLPLPYFLL